MEGTVTFELKPSLVFEMDFCFTPGIPAKLRGDPDFSEPEEGPLYEIEEIRVNHNKKWHKIPDWFWEILNFEYEQELIQAANEWLDVA
jgi:hypothetical protein